MQNLPRAVLWDMDGTLLDSAEYHWLSWREILAAERYDLTHSEFVATFGQRNTLYVGALRPWQIRIPPGVGHGYKVVGGEPGVLVYVTNQLYNPKDEGRVPYNEPGIAYDWETQHK